MRMGSSADAEALKPSSLSGVDVSLPGAVYSRDAHGARILQRWSFILLGGTGFHRSDMNYLKSSKSLPLELGI